VSSLHGRCLAIIALVTLSYAGCALLPYAGAAYDFCQTMYSGLEVEGRRNNHLLLPQARWTDLGDRLDEVDADIGGALAGRADAVRAELLSSTDRPSLEAVRVAVAGLCAAGHTVRLRYRVGGAGRRVVDDACADPDLEPRAWLPFRFYPLGRARR
jgi:hypothetical protein